MLSMSMCVDRKDHQQRTLTIRSRRPVTWIPDERVTNCFECKTTFTFFRRKHHCRSCGRIFCNDCSSHRLVDRLRVCSACFVYGQKKTNVEWLLSALSVMPVTFLELFHLRLLDKHWNDGVNILLGIYRDLQYKLPCHQYSQIEYRFLSTHYQEFANHVPWQVHTIMAMHQHGQLQLNVLRYKPLTCRLLLCSRTCQPFLTIGDIIRLAPVLVNVQLQRWVVQTWKRMSPRMHCLMMFWWVHISVQYPRLFNEGLLELCVCRLELVYALWFECAIAKDKHNFKILNLFQTRLCRNISPEWLAELKSSISFHTMLSQMSRKARVDNFFLTMGPVRLPWAPHKFVSALGTITQFNSSSRPVSVSLQTTTGSTIDCLLKNEDVRTDRLAMVIAHLINELTSDVHVQPYTVFPLNSSSGCIIMMHGAKTLYDIRLRLSLTNYIMSLNVNRTIKAVRQRFVSTCAGACLLAFTMGLGDRHLENIMVTPAAHLVHVDFGYILGEDPKHINSTMRITDDMVDAMGGKKSESFASFLTITTKAYESLRLHSSLWYQLLSSEYLIFKDNNRPLSMVKNHVYNRFVPGEWNDEAGMHIESVVENAAHTSWAQHAVDAVHSASNHFNRLLRSEV